MKKTIALLLILTLVFALCSCTDKENATEEKKNSPVVTETKTETQEETTTQEETETLPEEVEEPVTEPSTEEPVGDPSVDDPNATEDPEAFTEFGGEEGVDEFFGGENEG